MVFFEFVLPVGLLREEGKPDEIAYNTCGHRHPSEKAGAPAARIEVSSRGSLDEDVKIG